MTKIVLLTEKEDIANVFPHYDVYRSMDNLSSINLKNTVVIVLSFSRIIPTHLLTKATFLNVHNSLLPKYRGRHAFTWAIINNEKQVGYTLHKITDKIDAGDIISQVKFSVRSDEDINDVMEKGKVIMRKWLSKQMNRISKYGIKAGRKQNEDRATYVCMRKPSDALINWEKKSLEIYNLIRAVTPPYTPGAFTYIDKRKITITKSHIIKSVSYVGFPGQVVNIIRGRGIYVKTGDNILLVTNIMINGVGIKADAIIRRVGLKFNNTAV